MAANGANDAAVRGFLHQLLHSIVRQIENNDGRGVPFKDLLPHSEPNNYKANQLGTKLRLHCRHDRHCFRFGELSSVATGEETHELLHRWPS